MKPDFDDYEGLAEFIFNLSMVDILSLEARRIGLEDDPEYKRKLKRFKELAMADIMQNDSLPIASQPDEGEMKQYYEDNPDEFTTPGKVHLYEVLFNDFRTAKTYALKTRNLEKFKALASQYTERSGKRASGGDLGWINERMYPRLYKAAERAAIGDVIGPIPMGEKHSIIYVADKEPPILQDFQIVKQSIKETLEKLRRSQSFEKWVEDQKKNTSIKIYENNIRASINKAKYADIDDSSDTEVDSTEG